jgi:hypothetical protein
MSKRKTNAITPHPLEAFADQLIADRDRPAWNWGHLARQSVALRDEGKDDTALAIYIRRAMRAVLQGDRGAYLAALEEIIKLCKGL